MQRLNLLGIVRRACAFPRPRRYQTPGDRSAHGRASTDKLLKKSWSQRIATQRWTQAALTIDFVDVFLP
jgi:hypothetical protein